MEISICAATPLELAPVQAMTASLTAKGHQVRYCITGVGMLQSCFYIQQHIFEYHPQLLLQVGIAGCFDQQIPLGSVVAIEKEYLGSLGVEQYNRTAAEDNRQWDDIFDLGLQAPTEGPFTEKALINPSINKWAWLSELNVPVASAVTIDEITTRPRRIRTLTDHYHPAVESMEGAALHFNGLMHKIPFLQLRGVSNYVGERDKSKWQIGPALKAVTSLALQCLERL